MDRENDVDLTVNLFDEHSRQEHTRSEGTYINYMIKTGFYVSKIFLKLTNIITKQLLR